MGEMLGVPDKGAFALAYTQQRNADEVVERDSHDEQRHKYSIPLAALRLVIIIGTAQGQQSNEETHNK
ncbi:unnamed protein product [marine sediment metagenome]|uniref:Uncharacterized protein n=1 Tax=marine sediment metagenome TaxID=412755 RepID=X1V1A7_9ZZZZ